MATHLAREWIGDDAVQIIELTRDFEQWHVDFLQKQRK